MNANSLPRETGRHSPSPPAGPEMLKMGVGEEGRPSAFSRSPSPEKRFSADKMGGMPGRQGRWAGANRDACLYGGRRNGKGDIRGGGGGGGGRNPGDSPRCVEVASLLFLLCALPPGVTFCGRKRTSC